MSEFERVRDYRHAIQGHLGVASHLIKATEASARLTGQDLDGSALAAAVRNLGDGDDVVTCRHTHPAKAVQVAKLGLTAAHCNEAIEHLSLLQSQTADETVGQLLALTVTAVTRAHNLALQGAEFAEHREAQSAVQLDRDGVDAEVSPQDETQVMPLWHGSGV